MGDRLHSGGGAASRRGTNSGCGGCGFAGILLLLLPIAGVGFLILWLNGNILGWQTERDLTTFYDAVGRGDYVAAQRVVAGADRVDIRWWATAEAEGHGPPTSIRTVSYDFRSEFGEYGTLFYMVRYQDGSEEHNVIHRRRGQQLRLPPHGVEQGIRRCHPAAGASAQIEFGAIQQAYTYWIVPYTVVQPNIARGQFTAYADTINLNLTAKSNGSPAIVATCTR